MAKIEGEKNDNTMEVKWLSDPLDVRVFRNGTKVPRRKVKVRAVVGDDWIEQEAKLEPGTIQRIVNLIERLAKHGYEPRLANSIRFVHMYDKKQGLHLSPQLMQPFRDEVVKGVKFRLTFEGKELTSLEEARQQVKVKGQGQEDEVTPDPMVTCPKCQHRFRARKKNG